MDTARFPRGEDNHLAPVRLLLQGWIDRQKEVLDVIDALAVLRHQGYAFQAAISAFGADVDPACQRAAELALGADALRFTGYARQTSGYRPD